MNTKNLVIVAAIATVLVGATAIATADSVFAGKKREYSQATSQANACGNGEAKFDRGTGTDTLLKIPIGAMNVGCQNTDSQIQGDENGVGITAQQTFDD